MNGELYYIRLNLTNSSTSVIRIDSYMTSHCVYSTMLLLYGGKLFKCSNFLKNCGFWINFEKASSPIVVTIEQELLRIIFLNSAITRNGGNF